MKTKLNYLLTCSIILLNITLLKGQDTLLTYFDSNWEKVDSKMDAEFYRKSYDVHDKRNFIDYYVNGVVQSEGAYMSSKEEVKDGIFTYFNRNGIRTKTCEFSKGEKHGPYKIFYKDGLIKAEGKYHQNKKEETWKWYHRNGKPCSIEKYQKNEPLEVIYYDSLGTKLSNAKLVVYPTFGANEDEMLNYIKANFEYPLLARSENIEGTVVLKFMIDKNGKTSDHQVERSVHPLLDKAALKILATMKKWNPGMAHNQHVDFEYRLPIEYKLTD